MNTKTETDGVVAAGVETVESIQGDTGMNTVNQESKAGVGGGQNNSGGQNMNQEVFERIGRNTVVTDNEDRFKSEYKPGTRVTLGIGKEEVLEMDTTRVMNILSVLTTSSDVAAKGKNTVRLMFMGWDNDRREIAEIPQIRRYFAALNKKWSYWLWFLAKDQWHLVATLLSSFSVADRNFLTVSFIISPTDLDRFYFSQTNPLLALSVLSDSQKVNVCSEAAAFIQDMMKVGDARGRRSSELVDAETQKSVLKNKLKNLVNSHKEINRVHQNRIREVDGLKQDVKRLTGEVSVKDSQITKLENEITGIKDDIQRNIDAAVGTVRKNAEVFEFNSLLAQEERDEALQRATRAERLIKHYERVMRTHGIEPLTFSDERKVA